MKVELITASIVTFHNPKEEIKSVIDTFLDAGFECVLYLSDNSPNRVLEEVCSDSRVQYFNNGANIGFGAGHNLAIKKAIQLGCKYHFVLNPDVHFSSEIIKTLIEKMYKEPDIGAIMPKILNLDHSVQYLPKLLPSPFHLLIRLFVPLRKIFRKQYNHYVLKEFDDLEINVPTLSGCFSLFNLEALKATGAFDERFFMYFEDNDLSRRIHRHYKTLYFPSVYILHGYSRGAAKDFRLFRIYVTSAIRYFTKYGWLVDKERRQYNRSVLNQLKHARNSS